MKALLLHSLIGFFCVTTVVAADRDDAAGGTLLICGGGALDESIIDRFIELAGGASARLVVIPTASLRADESDPEQFLQPWRKHGVHELTLLHTRDRRQAELAEFLAPLRRATAVWISGGSQSRLAEAYVATAVEKELHALLARSGVIGGTSAGAAIMSRTMIASGKGTPVIKTGLGLLPGTIIDQHFLARKRQTRSLKALAEHPDQVGLGIDERTAAEVHDGKIRVMGDSVVTVMVARPGNQPVQIVSLSNGQTADLNRLRRDARGE